MVGFLASVAAIVMGWIPDGQFDVLHSLLLCASALVTASFASFILGKFFFFIKTSQLPASLITGVESDQKEEKRMPKLAIQPHSSTSDTQLPDHLTG